MKSFSLCLQIPEDFQTHLRGTFLDVFWNKGYRLKDRNLSYKINSYLILKYHLLFFKNVPEKSLTTYLWREVSSSFHKRIRQTLRDNPSSFNFWHINVIFFLLIMLVVPGKEVFLCPKLVFRESFLDAA